MIEKLKVILGAYAPGQDITPDASLAFDLCLNSVELFAFVCEIEEQFGVEISDDALRRLATVGDVAAYLEAA